MKEERVILTLEIGRGSVRGLVGLQKPTGEIGVIDRKDDLIDRVTRVVACDQQSLSQRVRTLVQRLESSTRRELRSAYVALPASEATARYGERTRSIDGVVTQDDLRAVIEAAQMEALEARETVISCRVVRFTVDGRTVDRPLGMAAKTLGVEVSYVACSSSTISYFDSVLKDAGIECAGFLLDIVASGVALVSAADLNRGVVVVDIGEETTTIGIWAQGGFATFSTISRLGVGGLAEDLAGMYRIPKAEAQLLLRAWGCAPPEYSGEDRRVEHDGKAVVIARAQVHHFLEVHVVGLLEEIELAVRSSGFAAEISEIVLTGGGSEMPGFEDLAIRWFQRHNIGCRAGGHQPVNFGRERIAPASLVVLGLFIEAVSDRGGSFYRQVVQTPWTQVREVLSRFFHRVF